MSSATSAPVSIVVSGRVTTSACIPTANCAIDSAEVAEPAVFHVMMRRLDAVLAGISSDPRPRCESSETLTPPARAKTTARTKARARIGRISANSSMSSVAAMKAAASGARNEMTCARGKVRSAPNAEGHVSTAAPAAKASATRRPTRRRTHPTIGEPSERSTDAG
nr:hypothetical protein [Microbacterium sp. SORGH_AS_0454]